MHCMIFRTLCGAQPLGAFQRFERADIDSVGPGYNLGFPINFLLDGQLADFDPFECSGNRMAFYRQGDFFPTMV